MAAAPCGCAPQPTPNRRIAHIRNESARTTPAGRTAPAPWLEHPEVGSSEQLPRRRNGFGRDHGGVEGAAPPEVVASECDPGVVNGLYYETSALISPPPPAAVDRADRLVIICYPHPHHMLLNNWKEIKEPIRAPGTEVKIERRRPFSKRKKKNAFQKKKKERKKRKKVHFTPLNNSLCPLNALNKI
jgi:hypothetical protein